MQDLHDHLWGKHFFQHPSSVACGDTFSHKGRGKAATSLHQRRLPLLQKRPHGRVALQADRPLIRVACLDNIAEPGEQPRPRRPVGLVLGQPLVAGNRVEFGERSFGPPFGSGSSAIATARFIVTTGEPPITASAS